MSTPNRGLWILQDGSVEVRTITSSREPDEGEARIKVLYSGINPADTKHVAYGICDTVIGYDFCGVVDKAGPGFPFGVGEVIAGSTPSGVGRPDKYGTHQNFITYPANEYAFKVPAHLPPEHAACLKVAVRSAADGLFVHLGLPLPGEQQSVPAGGLLVWGGTTSMGICAIQLAKAIGVHPVIVTASPKNHETLVQLGATACFDYKDDNVKAVIENYVSEQGTTIAWAFETVGSSDPPTADLAAACVGPLAKVVAARAHPNYPSVYAAKETSATIRTPAGGEITVPSKPEEAQRGQKALLWAIENYGTKFRIPNVHVLEDKKSSSEVIEILKAVAKGKAGFGKFVLKHPIA
ncbi:unnamed protein product [Clonostachys rhizophaga]|uniref:Enoyl reductase (ER) domain-containing protein n=1 Tax=Clonostachys rhizophaga TaxID=160324 RepID=A0A9N9UYA6_9HYPO|nr:unnamed protein product [Clonostachys rhizophaga]